MFKAKIGLLIAVLIIALAWIVPVFIVPRFRLGFEGTGVVSAAFLLIGVAVAGVICFTVAITAARIMRRSPTDRTVGGYLVLIASTVLTLAIVVINILWVLAART